MTIRVGSDVEKDHILSEYPYTAQVMHPGGTLIVAVEGSSILGFSWSFTRQIPAAVGQREEFINVIEVFDTKHQCKGIGSLIVKKCIEMAKENECYQVRAYCDINNTASHMLWVKNGFTVSPVQMENGQILGSFVAYKI